MQKNNKIVSDVLLDVAASFAEDKISIKEIKNAIRERGFAILLLVFSLPLTIPLPVPPGSTTIAAIPLLLFSLQMSIGMSTPWLPKWVENKSIKRTTLALIAEKTSVPLRKVEKITSARLDIIISLLGNKIFAILSLICSLSISLPVPLTNFIPAIGIVLMCLGVLNRDGLIMIIGIIVGIFGLCVSLSVIIFGPKMIIAMFKHIVS
ncbi:exopolysaccharide biosynthesis protein [Candidatus Xenohaliotis californiensis]|uniref:exopolysaccharide biosynthesis protein n=1 Tax=Candidatus Xenohaliotis californiensis TaxID=84677 RepID=UPI0030C85B3F